MTTLPNPNHDKVSPPETENYKISHFLLKEMVMAINKDGLCNLAEIMVVICISLSSIDTEGLVRRGLEEAVQNLLEMQNLARKDVIPVIYFEVLSNERGQLSISGTDVTYHILEEGKELPPGLAPLVEHGRKGWLGFLRLANDVLPFKLYVDEQ